MTVRDIDPLAARSEVAGDAVLVDVRELDEWQAGHAPEAVHVPLSDFDPGRIPTGVPVTVVCKVGGRSAQAAAYLDQHGYDVANVVGGMLAWQSAGLPVVTDDGAPGDVLR